MSDDKKRIKSEPLPAPFSVVPAAKPFDVIVGFKTDPDDEITEVIRKRAKADTLPGTPGAIAKASARGKRISFEELMIAEASHYESVTRAAVAWFWPDHFSHDLVSREENSGVNILKCIPCDLELHISADRFYNWLHKKL